LRSSILNIERTPSKGCGSVDHIGVETLSPTICLAGATLGTGNLGVSALCLSTIGSIYHATPKAALTVFDEGHGRRDAVLGIAGDMFQYNLCGEKLSRRYWQPESLWNIRVSSWIGGARNASARAILDAEAVLDLSGGDSFADLYGQRRFRAVTLLKQIVLENGIPLILLPKTYGPFKSPKNRRVAQSIVRRARMAWARDPQSFQRLKELLGADFDASRHCSGVDVAFALEAIQPTQLPDRILSWLEDRGTPLVGINISGLLFNQASYAQNRYGLKDNYQSILVGLVQKLLDETDSRILLISHVVTPPGHYESDVEACSKVYERCGSSARIQVLPALDDPRCVKWVIGKLDWFCGTRMHSTIAGLSSGVPTAAVAYSLKTLGVFETCGQADQVVDLRQMGSADIIEALIAMFRNRNETRNRLLARVPAVVTRASDQIRQVLRACAKRDTTTAA
jgi:colanic acid/amylovoran biosynthesis protein